MGIFDRFKKSQDDAPEEVELPVLCYRIAYFALPQLLFADAQRFISYFSVEGYPAGAYLFALGASALKLEPKVQKDEVLKFVAHSEELSPGRNHYILQYPEPSPFDMSAPNPVLAPHFSAVVQRGEDVSYYVLGQRPTGGTTFRAVLRDGANMNLGEGPAPELSAFIDFLRTQADDAKPLAGVMPKR